MGDHVVLVVDRLATPVDPAQSVRADGQTSGLAMVNDNSGKKVEENEAFPDGEEDQPLLQVMECRICQEEDTVENLETPCTCSGSLKYAHRKCVQRWCDEKGDTICEICHQPYQSGYTAPPPPPRSEDVAIDIRGWTISGTPLDLRDPRVFAMAEAERQFLEAEYDEYASSNASGASFCRSAALILMALLLLRHTMRITDGDGEGDSDGAEDENMSAFFSLFLLRVAGFLLPCYIMAWAMSFFQRRRQRQEAAALAATQVAFVLQAGQHRGLHFATAPAPTSTPHQEPSPQPLAPQQEIV